MSGRSPAERRSLVFTGSMPPPLATIARMTPNPSDAQETDKPTEAQLARTNCVWFRLLFLGVPTCAGASIMSGVGAIAGEHWIAAAMFFGLAARGLNLACGWTR